MCILLVFIAAWLLAACQSSGTPIATPLPSLTPAPTFTATPAPPGSDENPYVLGLVGNVDDPGFNDAGQYLADFLSTGAGKPFRYAIFPNYVILVNAMSVAQVHVAFLPPMTYLLARSRGSAQACLLANRYGLYASGTQYLMHTRSGMFAYFDETTQSNIADSQTALAQLQGKRPCYISPDSVSGYLLPAAILASNDVLTQEPVFVYSPAAAIRAVYITGICDFAATFALSGDPRTSASVLSDLTDVNERVRVLWRSDALLPELNVSTHPSVEEGDIQSIVTSFIVLSQTEEGRNWLRAAVNSEINNLMIIDDAFYQPLVNLLEGFEYDPVIFIGK